MRYIRVNSVADYVICLVLALGLVAAPYYIATGSCAFSFTYFITVSIIWIALLAVALLVRSLLIRDSAIKEHDNDHLILWKKVLNHKYAVVWITLIILICWSPIIISLYPGTLINDTWGQLNEYMGYFNIGGANHLQLSDHHPFFDTLVMGTIITPFGEILKNWQLGFFVYSIIQVLLTSFSFALTIVYSFKRLKLQPVYVLGMCLFYGLCPIFPIAAQTISKDALFSWIYVLFVILFIEIVRTQGKCLSSSKYLISMIVVASLCIYTKKVGLYIITISLLAVIVFVSKNRIRSSIMLGIILLLSVGMMSGIKRTLNVSPGGKQEMFSIPFQQSARYAIEHRNDMTKNEYRNIDKLIDLRTVGKRYKPTNADPIKGYTDRNNTTEFVNYSKSWYQQGKRHPKVYIAAFNAMVSGWFSFEEYLPLTNMGWHNQLNTQLIPERAAKRLHPFDVTSKIVQSVADNLYRNSLFQIFLSYALYASILPAFVLATLFRKWNLEKLKYYWLSAIPLILSIILGCWLAPVSIDLEGKRYLYPVIYTLPIMIMLCLSMYQARCSKKQRDQNG